MEKYSKKKIVTFHIHAFPHSRIHKRIPAFFNALFAAIAWRLNCGNTVATICKFFVF